MLLKQARVKVRGSALEEAEDSVEKLHLVVMLLHHRKERVVVSGRHFFAVLHTLTLAQLMSAEMLVPRLTLPSYLPRVACGICEKGAQKSPRKCFSYPPRLVLRVCYKTFKLRVSTGLFLMFVVQMSAA